MKHEIIIQVNSLEQSTYFYRETLKLGEPFIETRDMAVFHLGEEAALVLQRNSAGYLDHASSATSFALHTPFFDLIIAELEKSGETAGEESSHLGSRARRICDPENNAVLLVEA